MKRAVFAAVFLLAVFTLGAKGSALTYTDDMTTLYPDQIRRLSGFKQHQFSGAPRPDYTTVTPELKAPAPAYAEYRVRSATSVTAYLYSPGGTFAEFDGNLGRYRLGIYSEVLAFDPSRPPAQAMLCPDSGEVYTEEGGLKWLTMDESENQYIFESYDSHAPAGKAMGYGVNIYYSVDGESFTRANAGLSYFYYDSDNTVFYEAYTAGVPESAQYIRVSVNEMSFLRYDGEPQARPYDANNAMGVSGLALAAVTIYGPSLVPGVYDEEVPANLPSDGYERDRIIVIRDSGSRASSRASSSGSASSSASSASRSAPSSSAKFTGVITVPASSSSPSKVSSSRLSSSRSSSSPAPASSVHAEPELPLAAAPQAEASIAVEQIDPGGGSETFSRGVTAYIIVGLGGLVALMLFKPKV